MSRSNPETRRKRRQKRIANGLCPNCPNPVEFGKGQCAKCLLKLTNASKKRSALRKLNKICVRCKSPASNATMCRVCLDAWKDSRKQRIANKLCPYCGGPGGERKSICDECSNSRKQEAEHKRSAGICVRLGCKNKADANSVSCSSCKEKTRITIRSLKKIVLEHYGHKCNCECGCDITRFEHLTIDHKNSDGAHQRRKEKSHGGQTNYRRIIKSNFPDDLQILCWNCNCAKEYYGGCG